MHSIFVFVYFLFRLNILFGISQTSDIAIQSLTTIEFNLVHDNFILWTNLSLWFV
jgi:hypothetical protein